VDRAVDGFEELPEDRGGGVAQDRTVTAGEDRRHEAGSMAGSAVSHRVDATVNSMELATLNPSRHRAPTQTRCFQLPKRGDAMLPSGDLRHSRVEHVAFVTHQVTKATGLETLPLNLPFFALLRQEQKR
jgi:hypothetical protein